MQTLIAITILLLSFGKFSGLFKHVIANPQPVVTVTFTSPSPFASETPTPTISPKPKSDVKSLKVEVIEPIVSPKTSSDINYYKYPNSKIISSSLKGLELTTSDSSKLVSDWYKKQIVQRSLNVQSFVTTNTNDQILDKLVAAGGNTKVEVDIKGTEGQTLEVTVSTAP